ncbi:MAG TPA: GreA/GreB family elongation factor [Patescibacteria group bacterium]|jgi:transcription elongation factor GreA|nr:GreA/GreB family elongation factor [Patescibacteria group bacterium]
MGQYTRAAHERLERQVEELERLHIEAQGRLGEAAESDSNTWHDNFAFEQATRDIDTSKQRWLKAKRLLEVAVIVEKPTDGSVGIGSDIVYRFVGDDETETAHLAGEQAIREEDDEVPQVSTSSPIGKALLGAKAGETVTYTGPNGKKFAVEVLEVN